MIESWTQAPLLHWSYLHPCTYTDISGKYWDIIQTGTLLSSLSSKNEWCSWAQELVVMDWNKIITDIYSIMHSLSFCGYSMYYDVKRCITHNKLAIIIAIIILCSYQSLLFLELKSFTLVTVLGWLPVQLDVCLRSQSPAATLVAGTAVLHSLACMRMQCWILCCILCCMQCCILCCIHYCILCFIHYCILCCIHYCSYSMLHSVLHAVLHSMLHAVLHSVLHSVMHSVLHEVLCVHAVAVVIAFVIVNTGHAQWCQSLCG